LPEYARALSHACDDGRPPAVAAPRRTRPPFCRETGIARRPRRCLHRLVARPAGPGRSPWPQRSPHRPTPDRPPPPRRRSRQNMAQAGGTSANRFAAHPHARPAGRVNSRGARGGGEISARAWTGGQLTAATLSPKIDGILRVRARIHSPAPPARPSSPPRAKTPTRFSLRPRLPPGSSPLRRSPPPPPRRKNSLTTS
jgi:hypothetical protein